MGRTIRSQRKGRPDSIFKAHTYRRLGEACYKNLDYQERHGYVKGIVQEILHDPGRGAPVAQIQFEDPYNYRKIVKNYLAVEGMFTGQTIFCGKTASLQIGNILPIGQIPEGTLISNVEFRKGDHGKFARRSGAFVTIIAHSEDGKKSRVKLPSGVRKTIDANSRAMIGVIGAGGRNEKPILKAGTQFFRHRAKRADFPIVAGVRMNPVDHPHGGGNHKHLGKSSTVSRMKSPGAKVGLIAARRSGLLRGGKKAKLEGKTE